MFVGPGAHRIVQKLREKSMQGTEKEIPMHETSLVLESSLMKWKIFVLSYNFQDDIVLEEGTQVLCQVCFSIHPY